MIKVFQTFICTLEYHLCYELMCYADNFMVGQIFQIGAGKYGAIDYQNMFQDLLLNSAL